MGLRSSISLLSFIISCAVLADAAPIHVEGGLISGVEDGGVRVYKGIPFAAPPEGELRWRPPQPVLAWEGVREWPYHEDSSRNVH